MGFVGVNFGCQGNGTFAFRRNAGNFDHLEVFVARGRDSVIAIQPTVKDTVRSSSIDAPRQPNPSIGLHNRIQWFRGAVTGVFHRQGITHRRIFANHRRLLGHEGIPQATHQSRSGSGSVLELGHGRTPWIVWQLTTHGAGLINGTGQGVRVGVGKHIGNRTLRHPTWGTTQRCVDLGGIGVAHAGAWADTTGK